MQAYPEGGVQNNTSRVRATAARSRPSCGVTTPVGIHVLCTKSSLSCYSVCVERIKQAGPVNRLVQAGKVQ